MEGEIQLILSIIGQAVIDSREDYHKIKDIKKREKIIQNKKQALYWLNSDKEYERTFNYYCRLIDIDPGWARRKIKNNKNIFTNFLERETPNGNTETY